MTNVIGGIVALLFALASSSVVRFTGDVLDDHQSGTRSGTIIDAWTITAAGLFTLAYTMNASVRAFSSLYYGWEAALFFVLMFVRAVVWARGNLDDIHQRKIRDQRLNVALRDEPKAA